MTSHDGFDDGLGDDIALADDHGLDDELELGRMDALGLAEPATNGDRRAIGRRWRTARSTIWDEPVPLTGATSLPAFPVDAYPSVLADFVGGLD